MKYAIVSGTLFSRRPSQRPSSPIRVHLPELRPLVTFDIPGSFPHSRMSVLPDTEPVTLAPKLASIALVLSLPRLSPTPPPISGKRPVITTVRGFPSRTRASATAFPTPGRGITNRSFFGLAISIAAESVAVRSTTAIALPCFGAFFSFLAGFFLVSDLTFAVRSTTAIALPFFGAFFAFFAGPSRAGASASSGLRLRLHLPSASCRVQLALSIMCSTMARWSSISSSLKPVKITASISSIALRKMASSAGGSGSFSHTFWGTRQQVACTKRPYDPDISSRLPTRTVPFSMTVRRTPWPSSFCISGLPSESHVGHANRLSLLFAAGWRMTHIDRPVAAYSMRYCGAGAARSGAVRAPGRRERGGNGAGRAGRGKGRGPGRGPRLTVGTSSPSASS